MALQQKSDLNPLNEIICLDERYGTTRRVRQVTPEVVLAEIQAEQKLENQFKPVLFLPEGAGRQGEGGLRTRGYFKKSEIYKPLITVITVVFNGNAYLEETILSVINQTYDNVEYIVIDGASTDGTNDIIRKYENAIDYWVSESDGGIYDAMNKALSVARGEWINFMNAGDKFASRDVVSKVFEIELQDLVLIYGPTNLIGIDGVFLKNLKPLPMSKMSLMLFDTRVACHQSVIYRRNKKFYYPSSLSLKGELDSYFRFLKEGRIKRIDITISDYLLGGIGERNKEANSRELLLVLKNHCPYFWLLNYPVRLFIKVLSRLSRI